jgi:cardiolipin synthase
MRYRLRIRLRRIARKVLHTGDPPERVARGLAAGVMGAAFPLPGLQIPISLLFAWIARGNKAVSILPQFISNAGTMLPLAYLQFRLGARLWPGRAAEVEEALSGLKDAANAWTWSAPAASVRELGRAVGALGTDALGPLLVGVLVSGAVLAVATYFVSLIGLSIYQGYRLRWRAAHGIGLHPPKGHFAVAQPVTGMPTDVVTALRYVYDPEEFVEAERVKLLVDGREAYPEMLAAIGAARESVDLETYILQADVTGHRFAAALMAAALRGVKTRLLYDGVGSLGLPAEFVDGLLMAGVQTAVYRPVSRFLRLGLMRMNRRDHRKILVVDGKIAFTGGLNIGDEYAAEEDGGGGWRDTHVRVDGEAPARALARVFESTWARADMQAGTAAVSAERAQPAEPRAPAAKAVETVAPRTPSGRLDLPEVSERVPLQVLSNREFLQRWRVRRAYLHAIRRAKRYILIENAYFVPDRRIRRALQKAVRRGVAVGVVVAERSDLPIVAMASRALYGELLASGVRLFEYRPSMLHCKAAVIDDVWSVVASYNLDHRSLMHNLEAGVLLLDRNFALRLRHQIVTDIEHSREVTLQAHKARPWDDALLETLAYQARYWL